MSNDTELIERLAVTLRAKAAEVMAPESGFTAVRGDRMPAREPLPAPEHRKGRRPRRMLAVAAAVLVVAAIGGAMLLARDQSGGPARIETGPAQPGGPKNGSAEAEVPDGILAPSWTPDGLYLWGLTWSRSSSPATALGRYQLFSSPDDGPSRVFVWVQPGGDGSAYGDPVTVRGVEGSVGPAKEFPDTTSTIFWNEGNASVSASFTGMSLGEAIAFLDSLAWRSGDHLEGFAPPEDGSLSLAGETGEAQSTETLAATFDYDGDPPTFGVGEGRQLEVRTSTRPGDLDEGTFSYAYLQAWFNGTRDGNGAVASFDPEFNTLRLVRPEGGEIWIDASGTPLSEDEARQVADSISPVTGRELEGLQVWANGRLAELPLVASVELPSATLEVRGKGDLNVLCVDAAGDEPTCPLDDELNSKVGTPPLVTSLLIDGTWYVAAVAAGESPSGIEVLPGEGLPDAATPSDLATASDDDVQSTDNADLVSESGTDGDWSFFLALPPSDIDLVTMWFIEPTGPTDGRSLKRPRMPR